jgi:5-hydroxyisourate hydrolase
VSKATTISTHVLDTAFGVPAADIAVTLERVDAQGASVTISTGVTNADGRVPSLAPANDRLTGGKYRLRFDVAAYFAATNRKSFFAEICVDFEIDAEPEHYHVPLLLSPFAYSTYRGS